MALSMGDCISLVAQRPCIAVGDSQYHVEGPVDKRIVDASAWSSFSLIAHSMCISHTDG